VAQDIQLQLSQYIQDPLVSVIVNRFAGTFSEQIRIVGATGRPASIPYRANMTILDAMIAVGGMNEFAAGNRSKLVRFDKATGKQKNFRCALATFSRRVQGQRDADAGRCDHHPRKHLLSRAVR
jgi:polysaccharide export outer membrane protein